MRFRALSIQFSLFVIVMGICPESQASAIGCTDILAWLGAGVSSRRIAEVVKAKGIDFDYSAEAALMLRHAGATTELHDDDEVAVLPPVSGGAGGQPGVSRLLC